MAIEKKKKFDGSDVEVLGPDYAEGKPDGADRWRTKLDSRANMLAYLKTGERYWYANEGYGSEKRKNPA